VTHDGTLASYCPQENATIGSRQLETLIEKLGEKIIGVFLIEPYSPSRREKSFSRSGTEFNEAEFGGLSEGWVEVFGILIPIIDARAFLAAAPGVEEEHFFGANPIRGAVDIELVAVRQFC
jgi:hypothetical protein